jgi:hypothetical protein
MKIATTDFMIRKRIPVRFAPKRTRLTIGSAGKNRWSPLTLQWRLRSKAAERRIDAIRTIKQFAFQFLPFSKSTAGVQQALTNQKPSRVPTSFLTIEKHLCQWRLVVDGQRVPLMLRMAGLERPALAKSQNQPLASRSTTELGDIRPRPLMSIAQSRFVDERMHLRTLRESESLRFRSQILQTVTRLSSNRRNRSKEMQPVSRPRLHHSLLETVVSNANAIDRRPGEWSFSSGGSSVSSTPSIQTTMSVPRYRRRDVELDATNLGILRPTERSHPEIVWRKQERAIASIDNRDEGVLSSNHQSRSASLSGPTDLLSNKPQEHGMAKGSPTQASTSQISIDSKMLDRLTDDVIRRVERKLRIDRERRGLGN